MNDNNESSKQNQVGFWSTLPGVLTALGTLVVAVTGLVAALNQAGLIGNNGPGTPDTNEPPVAEVDLPQQTQNSPEHLLNEYALGLTNRDFVSLIEIYPTLNETGERDWLEGRNGKLPIETIQLVGQARRIVDSESEVVLRARMQYCREDGSGSTDIKNYTFLNSSGAWELATRSAPEEVTSIRC
ncbi:MAG: hypothetical protein VKL39_00820 [Leptolyngbyaceae bacterium]|nr:hypothetical protein [Leptolyngbyaceae bacterium]